MKVKWIEKKLSEIATMIDYRGKTPQKTEKGIPLITAKIVKNGIILPANEFIAKENYASWMTRGYPLVGDVVLTTEAPLGEVAQLREANVALAQRIITIRGKEGILDNSYLKYFLQSSVGQARLRARETGTTVTGIKASELREISIPVPDIKRQQQIAKMLLDLDEKIYNTTQINHNLEEQANILLEQNCSHRKSLKLGDIISFVNGYAFKSSSYVTKGAFKVITIKNVQDGKIETSGADCVSEIPENMKSECALQIGDILLSLTGNVGRTGIVCEENLLLNQRVAKIVPHKRELLSTIYFIFRRAATKKSLETISRGTAQLNLSPVETLDVKIPLCIESLVNMAPFLDSFFEQIVSNEQECQRLIKLRDALLPKLMSGEIDVSEVEV